MSFWIRCGLIVLGSGVALALLITLVRTGRPVKLLLGTALQGFCALGLVNLLGVFTGVSLGFGWFAVGVCGGLGIPGATGLLLLKLIFPAG